MRLSIYWHLSCTCSIWGSTLHWLDKCLLYTTSNTYIACSGTPVTCCLSSFGKLVVNVNPIHSLPVDRKYQTGQSMDNHIILLFNLKYQRRCINVICLQNHNINAISWSIGFVCIRSTKSHCTKTNSNRQLARKHMCVKRVWRYQIGNQNPYIEKDRKHNGQKKKDIRTNNDLQNMHIQIKIE
jgi:hypothetical protein